MSVPNPIIIDAQMVAQTNVVQADALGDEAVNAETLTDNRPMPHITIGEVQTLATGEDATATMTGDYVNPVLNLGLPRGEQGIQGIQGEQGIQGIQGVQGEPGRDGADGKDGKDGEDGAPGFSPTASVSKAGNTATITITDEDGTTTATITDGTNGTNGENGQDGFSPVATVTKVDDTATISITDKNGTTTASISDGYQIPADGIPASDLEDKYAAADVANGSANFSNGIHYGAVDATSTSTKFTATIPGITSYYHGLIIFLKNGVVTSASGFTININGLGAKPSYSNMSAATADTTLFNINYTMLFIYDENRIEGGCWVCYRGYNSDTNTIGYQLRTNSTLLTVTDTARYYKLYFSSADNTKWVPASVNSKNDATTARAVNQRPINPFGRIVYTSASTSYAANANLAASTIWDQYIVTLGYSFNPAGGTLALTAKKPVYVKCAPQTDGSAIMDATTPIVQDLPTTADGKIYIYLGVATEATKMELYAHHQVYHYYNGAIRLWTGPV